jgi:hypothetical protein
MGGCGCEDCVNGFQRKMVAWIKYELKIGHQISSEMLEEVEDPIQKHELVKFICLRVGGV